MERKIVWLMAQGVVGVAWRGRLTGQDLATALHDIYADSRWHDGFSTVWVYDELQALEVTPADVEAIYRVEIAQTSEASTGADVAVVRRELDAMMAQLFIAMAERHLQIARPKGFGRSIEEALASVGLDSAMATPLRQALAQSNWTSAHQKQAS